MTYNPAVRNQEYIFFVGLPSQANPKIFQANPTIAADDFKVSKNGGTLTNLATLPTVTPASGKMVKVTLSASEMDGNNVTVVCSDAAGDEWCDVIVNIHPVGWITYSNVNDASRTTTSFDTDLSETTDDHYNGSFIVFTDGALQGQSRKVSAYDGTNKTITVATPFTEAPANFDTFVIIGRSE